MDTYIRELKNHIQHFEFHLSQFDALDQPAYSQRRNLKASMELYKKTQYIPSSNWLSPGRDIAIAFFYGISQERMTSFSKYPCQHGHRGPQPSTADTPEVLRQHYPNPEIMMIAALNLNEKNTIRPGSFVLEQHPFNPHGSVGFVDSIWEVGPRVFYAKINKCIKIGIQQENSMTILSKEERYVYTPVEQIICTLNVQHDCFSGNCPTFQTTLAPVGRQEGTTVTQQLLHTDNNRYLFVVE
ncbi:hypothetical protein KEM48_005376 [Puccinia striiformis f. sp. tritici PST-130]|nr:hypothetical protein KEM48_005376 [Puccinia striiformis f. sp. tritici PST-130]